VIEQAAMRMQAGQLTSAQVWQRIRVTVDGDVITGKVLRVDHRADAVDISTVGEPEQRAFAAGRYVEIRIAPWNVEIRVPAWRHVEILDDPKEGAA
jgi:hypothetical protein